VSEGSSDRENGVVPFKNAVKSSKMRVKAQKCDQGAKNELARVGSGWGHVRPRRRVVERSNVGDDALKRV